jgi:diketogulonate reductase-like aldo/keto reductase
MRRPVSATGLPDPRPELVMHIWQLRGEVASRTVREVIGLGRRRTDTATGYGNEVAAVDRIADQVPQEEPR